MHMYHGSLPESIFGKAIQAERLYKSILIHSAFKLWFSHRLESKRFLKGNARIQRTMGGAEIIMQY